MLEVYRKHLNDGNEEELNLITTKITDQLRAMLPRPVPTHKSAMEFTRRKRLKGGRPVAPKTLSGALAQ